MSKRLHIGGVMRCCIHTLGEFQKSDRYTEADGTVLRCLYCSSSLIAKPDGWRWNQQEENMTQAINPQTFISV